MKWKENYNISVCILFIWKRTTISHCWTRWLWFHELWNSCYKISLVVQVVQNILPPVPLNIPMVLIKPPEACSTADVYKVMLFQDCECIIIAIIFYKWLYFNDNLCILQRLRLDKTSKIDPLQVLDKISSDGISQDVCINDLGTYWMLKLK